jgi:hypothetical protein
MRCPRISLLLECSLYLFGLHLTTFTFMPAKVELTAYIEH